MTLKSCCLHITSVLLLLFILNGCSNKSSPPPPGPAIKPIAIKNSFLNGNTFDVTIYGTQLQPVIRIEFTEPVKTSSIGSSVKITDPAGVEAAITTTLQNHDSVLLVQPASPLNYLSKYNFLITTGLRSSTDGSLSQEFIKDFITKIDSSRKFPVTTDNALLDLIQQQTFKYFWDYGHPVSGLARERSNAT